MTSDCLVAKNRSADQCAVLSRSLCEWRGWQEWYPGRNDFNRDYIFSLAQTLNATDIWMFGGIWQVLGIEERPDELGVSRKFYEVELTSELDALIGRLKLHRVHRKRGTRVNLENHYDHFEVAEILPGQYTGAEFPGFHQVNIRFSDLEMLIDNDRTDWSTALASVKGVYLITDEISGRRYVGSAYGSDGIWSRWVAYVRLGHGGNEGMMALLRDHDLSYCRRGFRFSLLESLNFLTPDQDVIRRENFWKEVLATRDKKSGLNRN